MSGTNKISEIYDHFIVSEYFFILYLWKLSNCSKYLQDQYLAAIMMDRWFSGFDRMNQEDAEPMFDSLLMLNTSI